MSGGVVAIVIVVIITSMGVWLAQIQHGADRAGKRRNERGGGTEPRHLPSPREAELQREIEDLRERVKVLERITTDAHTSAALQSRSIAAEIESLRDR